MKKFATILAAATFALPLAFAAPLAASAATTATAATTTKAAKATTYNIVKGSLKNFKAKSYHIKTNIPLYSAKFSSNKAKVSFTRKGNLTKPVTYKVTQSVKVKTKTNKTASFYYVKGYGYVQASKITKGIYMPAD